MFLGPLGDLGVSDGVDVLGNLGLAGNVFVEEVFFGDLGGFLDRTFDRLQEGQLQFSLGLFQLELLDGTLGESVPVLQGEVDGFIEVADVGGGQVGTPQTDVLEGQLEVFERVDQVVFSKELAQWRADQWREWGGSTDVGTVDLGGDQTGVVSVQVRGTWGLDG